MYDRDLIDSLLASIDIADVVRHYLHGSVQKKGKNFVAMCPFHDDHDPSLSINEERQIYKCFVCGHGGNAIKFVQEYEHLNFAEAVRKLAEIAGFHDPRLLAEAPVIKIDPEKKKLYDCINDLQAYYRYSLTTEEGKIARDYLAKRHLDLQTQAKYGIGYSPNDGAKTIAFLLAKGHSLKSIEDIGVAALNESGGKDRNAGRLTFPLFDSKGQVVGFSARQLVKDENSGKYINSPETPIFHKGDVLYNYHNVVSIAHHDGKCYVLEGFMDVMALDKAGIPDAVALMGTALTDMQAQMLKRLNADIRLCLDGDDAGQTGMMRAIKVLSKAKVPFQFVDYGGDLRDPDDILQEEGSEALQKKMNNLIDAVDFELDYYSRVKKIERAEDKQTLVKHFLPLLASEDELTRENHLAKLARALSFEPSAIRLMLKKQMKKEKESEIQYDYQKSDDFTPSPPMVARLTKRLAKAEDTVLYYLLHDEEARRYVAEHGNPLYSSLQRTLAYLIIQYGDEEKKIELPSFLAYLDQQEDRGKELSDAALEADSSKNVLPYSLKAMEDCKAVIEDEKRKGRENLRAREAIETGDTSLAVAALKELASKKSANWKKGK